MSDCSLIRSILSLSLRPDEGNQALQEFLQSKNPRQEHSSTLESYLIKPIQRILKYPLLLLQLKNLTDPYCDEHMHLIEALKGMEKVAEHINEMQRIHEEYGAIFDHLFRQHQKSCKQPIDMSPGEQPGDDSTCDIWQKYRNLSIHNPYTHSNFNLHFYLFLSLSLVLPIHTIWILKISQFKDSIACLGDLLYYGGVEWLNISDFLGKIKKGLELHAMCFVFKSAVVFLCKERLRQKKKIMVSQQNCRREIAILLKLFSFVISGVMCRVCRARMHRVKWR